MVGQAAASPKTPIAAKTAGKAPVRALFLNDTSRNGGPGRTLFYILKFTDPALVHRTVVLPRAGVVSELLLEGDVVDTLHFVPNLIENVIEPWNRAMDREDFDAPLPLRVVRATGNVARGTAAFFELAKLIRRERVEVIFCNGTTANFAGGGLAALTGIPVIWHVFYSSIAAPIAALHARLAAGKNVRSILCVSSATAKLFEHCQEKVRITHDAIDTAEFAPDAVGKVLRSELGFGPEHVVFGSQGRILPRKGYLEMVRAARLALDRMPEKEARLCRFVVLGDTPADMKPNHLDACRDEVKKLGLESVFTFTGYRPDVRPYVNDFSVAVVPSIYEDPLPRAVIEAMALAKPVIAFDVGGIPEMIEDGVTGALVRGSPPDLEGLANAFVRYAGDAGLRRRHGDASRVRAQREFDSKAHGLLVQKEILRIVNG
jgi:glycosyltransferase involved in cell wall biosynthesis